MVPKREDELEREKFTHADMRTIRRNLHRLDKSDQLLVRLLASTAMRLAEVYEIDNEKKEHGVRYVEIETKTEQSERRGPFPEAPPIRRVPHRNDSIGSCGIAGSPIQPK
jgi:hypothetical protein